MSDFLHSAFHAVLKEAKTAEGWYVSLMERVPRYGGPEEGGWWTSDTHVVSYQYFETEEAAQAAKEAVDKLANELSQEERKAFGEQMLREMAWLDARGLDSDFLPEPDGETEYYVLMTQGLPESNYGPTHYE